MLFTVVYNKGLDKKLLTNIKQRAFSKEELTVLHEQIRTFHLNKVKEFRVIFILLVLMVNFITGLSVMSSTDRAQTSFLFLVLIIIVGGVLLFVKRNFVDKAKKQFVNALFEGYPEFLEEFGEATFH